MILLHEREKWRFLSLWQEFKDKGCRLPVTKDPDYASPEALLRHVMGSSRNYMTWICQVLDLPDPGIRKTPEVDEIEGQADEYLNHLLEKYRKPLYEILEDRFYEPTFKSRWGTDYCIDAMLEHAVMHSIRHSFQLEELMKAD